MKKLTPVLAIAILAFSSLTHAQNGDPKREWATKVVALQQGPELQKLVGQLAESAAQEVVQNWAPKLQDVPKAKQEQVANEFNAEVKGYFDDVSKIINGRVVQVSNSALIPAYMEKFSVDELKQIATFFDSPVIKKYQASAPELGGLFVKELVEATRAEVTVRFKQTDETIAKIATASGVAAAPARPAAAQSGTAKPAPKK